MNGIQQVAAAETVLVRALQTATDRLNQIGTDKVDRAKADFVVACQGAKDRLRDHMAEVALLLADVASAFGDLGVEIVADVTASVTVTTAPADPLPAPAPVPAVEGSPESCPQCGPYTATECLTPTARRCTACSRQWSVSGLDGVVVGDDDEGTVDLGWDGSTETVPTEPVNRVATATKPGRNGRSKRK